MSCNLRCRSSDVLYWETSVFCFEVPILRCIDKLLRVMPTDAVRLRTNIRALSKHIQLKILLNSNFNYHNISHTPFQSYFHGVVPPLFTQVATMDNAKKIKNDIEAQGHQVDNEMLRQTYILPNFEKGKNHVVNDDFSVVNVQ